MARIVLQYIGEVRGMPAYAPLDQPDIDVCKDRNVIVCDVKSDKVARTSLQNRALYLYFRLLAKALNAAGWDMKRTLSKKAEIPWSESTVKENLFHPLQEAMTGEKSTTKLDTRQVSEVYEVLNRHTSSKLGVGVPFPERHHELYRTYSANVRRGNI